MEAFAEKFWAKVRKSDECWEWTGTKSRGYGYIWDPRLRKIRQAYRIAFEFTNGSIPEGLCVCHRCDNPGCVRPDHLFLGTQSDNLTDCVGKGRHRGFQNQPNNSLGAKLDAATVLQIREAGVYGLTCRQIARDFHISKSQAHRIITGGNWKTV